MLIYIIRPHSCEYRSYILYIVSTCTTYVCGRLGEETVDTDWDAQFPGLPPQQRTQPANVWFGALNQVRNFVNG